MGKWDFKRRGTSAWGSNFDFSYVAPHPLGNILCSCVGGRGRGAVTVMYHSSVTVAVECELCRSVGVWTPNTMCPQGLC